jgi:hypothetical protein
LLLVGEGDGDEKCGCEARYRGAAHPIHSLSVSADLAKVKASSSEPPAHCRW